MVYSSEFSSQNILYLKNEFLAVYAISELDKPTFWVCRLKEAIRSPTQKNIKVEWFEERPDVRRPGACRYHACYPGLLEFEAILQNIPVVQTSKNIVVLKPEVLDSVLELVEKSAQNIGK